MKPIICAGFYFSESHFNLGQNEGILKESRYYIHRRSRKYSEDIDALELPRAKRQEVCPRSIFGSGCHAKPVAESRTREGGRQGETTRKCPTERLSAERGLLRPTYILFWHLISAELTIFRPKMSFGQNQTESRKVLADSKAVSFGRNAERGPFRLYTTTRAS